MSNAMRMAMRLGRGSLVLGVFAAVAWVSWFATSSVLTSRTSANACVAPVVEEVPVVEASLLAASTEAFQVSRGVAPERIEGMGGSGGLAHVFQGQRLARPGLSLMTGAVRETRRVGRAQAPSPPHEPEPVREELRVRPAMQLDCSFDKGSFRCGECATDGDCPQGQGCVINYDKRRFECADSECEDDSHCFPGDVCRVAAGELPGPAVRRCLKAGVRQAGETCSRLPTTADEACVEGLLCINHHCGPPCEPGQPGTCPEGETCEQSSMGAACLPDCRKSGCMEGRACAALNGGSFQCLELVVDECSDEQPCGGGKNCVVRGGRGGRAGRFCSAACESWRPESCGKQSVCGVGGPTGSTCYTQCDPDKVDSCPERWICSTVTEDLQSWGCMPDFLSGASTTRPRRGDEPPPF
ncbi:hypothetical protein ACJ2CR_22015 [Myxococcus faecalis]|uniref:hypothetical protein n=1 Tax=Myxococcus faecalis TaxID=3115646 RepID=UPI0038D21974